MATDPGKGAPRGGRRPAASSGRSAGGSSAKSTAPAASAAEPAPPQGGYAPECYACPIGTVSMAVQRMRPEAGEHFLRAAREAVLGLRSLVEVLTETLQTMEERSRSARSIENIPIRRS